MIDKLLFKKTIGLPLEKAGFKKRGQSWYLNGDDSIVIFNLQKCDWEDSYFFNLGIWLKALGEETFPKYNYTHMYYRLENFFPEEREILVGLNISTENIKSLEKIEIFLESKAIPFFRKCTKEMNLMQFHKMGLFKGGFLSLGAKWYFDVEDKK
jgi:hypothetical protein